MIKEEFEFRSSEYIRLKKDIRSVLKKLIYTKKEDVKDISSFLDAFY